MHNESIVIWTFT